jgi:hypothetical protein
MNVKVQSSNQFQITNILKFGICHSFGICLPVDRDFDI